MSKKLIFIFLIDVILLVVASKYCKYIYDVELQRAIFTSELEEFSKENENPVFKIGKIVLYSSANVVDNSDGKLEDIDISEFTDIAIYIDNRSVVKAITPENTIKEIYIDNIKITSNSDAGKKILNYKNPKEFGKYTALENYENEKIPFKVLTTNNEISKNDLSQNVFCTDCSNPLTLGFVNKNFITKGKVSDTSGQLLFDGSIFKNANVDLEQLSGKIEFYIHIKNNLGENFICNVVLDNDLKKNEETLLSGYSIDIDEPEGQIYNFLKVSEDKK